MRIVSVHPARDPVLCGSGPVRIGSAADDDVVPVGVGVEPHHVTIVADRRGLVLSVRPGGQRVYVNARVVRERAVLHFGDTFTLGANKFLLTSDAAPGESIADSSSAGPVTLRVVSGAESGRTLVVAPDLHLGAGSRTFADLDQACRIFRSDHGLIFETASPDFRVNGWPRLRAALGHGDQIALGGHRLLVEAPGLQFATHLASLPPPVPRDNRQVVPDDAPRSEIWWLIGAAAILAGVIALFLYFRW